MSSNIYFNISALLINIILIIFFFQKRNVPILQNRIYLLILIILSLSTSLDFIITLVSSQIINMPTTFSVILQSIFHTLTNSIFMCLAMYCLGLVDFLHFATKKHIMIVGFLIVIPFVISTTLIWILPVLDLTTSRSLKTYNLITLILSVINSLYLIGSFIFIMIHKNRINCSRARVLFASVLAVILLAMLQLKYQNLGFQFFAMSLAILIFFFYIQRPEEVIDSITGLFNSTAFVRMLPTVLYKQKNTATCISIILDDTQFLVNAFGLAQLNNFMAEVAAFLKETFKKDYCYNLAKGIFCVVIKNPQKVQLIKALETLQSRFKLTWNYDTIELKLYSRICVVECPNDAISPETVLDYINLVEADERYKTSLIYAKDVDLAVTRHSTYIEHILRKSIADNLFKVFEVYYQPIYSTKQKRLIGAEALVRLKNEDGSFISPEDFIPIAERTGTILRIGEFVFASVCRTLSDIKPEEYGIERIHINLSVAQCMQEILADEILTIRNIYQVKSSMINLEITETAAAHTPGILKRNIEHLADAGIELSLDDYGSGSSNMKYLLSFPFKVVKIDREIIWTAFFEPRKEAALKATINMIHSLDMYVLAEGCETEEQANWLIELKCDYIQGFYYAKPMPKDEFLIKMQKEFLSN